MRYGKPIAITLVATALSLGNVAASADPIVVVSPRSAITMLSKYDVADIFLGRTNRLPDGTPIVPIDQREGSPIRNEFYLEFTGKSPAQLKAYWSKLIFTGRGKPPMEVSGGNALKGLIAANPNAIGYLDSQLVDDTVRTVIIK